MSRQKQSLGRWGEAAAAAYLEANGYQIIDRNPRNEYGEVDLVARQGECIVFIEVKARSSSQFGFPEEAITPAKQQHMLEAAESYLQTHPELDGDWRLDVIAILRVPGGPPEILHFENALS
jgi:putative endonuclease